MLLCQWLRGSICHVRKRSLLISQTIPGLSLLPAKWHRWQPQVWPRKVLSYLSTSMSVFLTWGFRFRNCTQHLWPVVIWLGTLTEQEGKSTTTQVLLTRPQEHELHHKGWLLVMEKGKQWPRWNTQLRGEDEEEDINMFYITGYLPRFSRLGPSCELGGSKLM